MPSSLAMVHSSTSGYSPRPPVSVCGTGARALSARGFSRGPLGQLSARPEPRGTVAFGGGRILARPLAYTLQPGIPSPGVPSTAPSPHRLRGRYGNVHPSSIGWPLRGRLRARLTLIRLALIRKPWPCGVPVFNRDCRYSCLHLLFHALQQPSPAAFAARGMLPYLPIRIGTRASAAVLMPDYCRRPAARPVSCYALFKGIAASKLTSWLSLQLDRLCST